MADTAEADERIEPAPTPGVSIRLDMDAVTVAAVLLIALQVVIRLVVVLPSYFWQDDFIRLELSRREGLSLGLLLRDYNDHLEIVPSFLYWVLSHGPDRSFLIAGLIIVAMQLVASVLFWRLLTTIFGRHPFVLVALALYLFAPLSLVTVTWFASAVEALSFQIALFTMLLAQIHLQQDGRYRWAVTSVCAYAGGLLFWEKAAVILPTTVALLVLVVWRDVPMRERARRLVIRWPVWAAHVLVLGAFLVLYFIAVDGSERLEASAVPYLRSAGTMILQVFVPGVLGGPWHASGAENTLYPRSGAVLIAGCLAVVAAVVVASFRVSGPAAAGPWAMAALYLAGDIALLLWGRAYYLEFVNRDPRYVADAVPVLALCLAAAFLPGADPGRRLAFRGTAASVAAVVTPLLVASCLFTTSLLAPVLQRTYARNFVDGLISEFERNPGASVVNTDVPVGVAALDQRSLLAAVGFEAPFDQPGTEMSMFDSLAELRDVEIDEPTVELTGPKADCGWPVGRQRVWLGTLPSSSFEGYLLRLGYVTGAPARLHVEVDGLHQAVDVEPGIGYAYFVVEGRSGSVYAWVRLSKLGVCVSDLTAGKPWPAD